MMTNRIQLAALDLDGTCLNREGALTDRTKQVIVKVGRKGIQVVIATGRPLRGVPEELFQMEGIHYIIALNGSRVYDVLRDETIFVQGLSRACFPEIAKAVKEHRVLADIFSKNQGYCEKNMYEKAAQFLKDENFCRYYLQTRVPVEGLWEKGLEQYHPIEKINLFFADGKEKKRMKEVLSGLPDTRICSGMENNLELNHNSIDKGRALERLGQHIGVSMEEMLSCGDGGNDAEMIQQAGIGIAMGNASDELKKLADYITLTNEEDGAAYALEHFLL